MLGSVVSQNSLYLAPQADVFKLLSSVSLNVKHIILQSKEVIGCQLLTINTEHELSKSTVVQDNLVQKFIMTGRAIEQSFVDKLLTLSPLGQWSIGAINEVIGVSSIQLQYAERLSDNQRQSLLEVCIDAGFDLNEIRDFPTLSEPGLVVLDMDSTSITIECIDEIAKLAGVGEEVAEITELAMQGKLDFSQSLRSRVSKLKGIELSLLDEIADNLPLMPGMKELAAQFQKHDWKVAIASGGFTYFADNLKTLLGLDEAVSNRLGFANGLLTGEIEGQIVDAQVKAETVETLAKKYGISLSQTIAIGDGANDLKMMDKAALGIAFHAKPLVQQQADIAINQGDLKSIIALLLHS